MSQATCGLGVEPFAVIWEPRFLHHDLACEDTHAIVI